MILSRTDPYGLRGAVKPGRLPETPAPPATRDKPENVRRAKQRLFKVGHDEMVRAIGRYKAELAKDSEWRRPQNGSTFFNSGYLDYLDADYVPQLEK